MSFTRNRVPSWALPAKGIKGSRLLMVIAVFVSLLMMVPCSRADLNQGLMAYYPFDGSANDASGNGNNGMVHGAMFETNVAGRAIALHFNGTSGTYVQVPHSTSLEPTNAISISFWCKGVPGAGANYGTILRKADGCQPGYIIRTAGYRPDITPVFKIDPPNPCSVGDVGAAFTPCAGNAWQHFAATYSRTNGWIRTYVNGVQVNQTALAITLSNSGDLFIGGATVGGDDGGFDGWIDDLRIYNRALTPDEVAQLADLNPVKTRYEVATAHLDTQWRDTMLQTINLYIPKTLTNNFALFEKYPDYTFNFEGAFRYQLAKEYYPAYYTTLSNYIAQGRWRVAGSAMDSPDVNVPSPESLIRHVLYANHFWKQEFGKTSVDLFLPDCYGFGYALPSVAAHCGLIGFTTQKLDGLSARPIPFFNIGRWVGPDGNSVVAALQPGSYVTTVNTNLATDPNSLTRINDSFAETGSYVDYRLFGTGDTGGSPDETSVNWVEQSVTTTNGPVRVISAGSDQLFRDLDATNVSKLPSYQGELLLQTHGTGAYTSSPELKKYNRENELRADAAERLAVIADWLQGGGVYPQEKLTRAWERFLHHQDHGDLPGVDSPDCYPFIWNDELLSLNEFGSEETHGAGVLAQALDTTANGVPLVVCNILSIPREDIVEAMVNFTNGAPTAVRVFDANGNEVPSQMGAPVGNAVPVTFLAAVPAMGATVFDVRPSATACSLNTGLSVSTSQLENQRYRVQLDANGDVSSIFDKLNNRELLNAPIRWAFFHDVSVTWPAWEILYQTVTAPPTSCLGDTGSPGLQILENGPARVTLGVTRFNASSAFTEKIRLASGGAGDSVEWNVSATWGSLQTLLKVVFPLAPANPAATYDLGLGTIQRTNDSSSLYEVPAQQWADLTATNDSFGVTILNDSKYGWDKPDDHTLRLTIFHSPKVDDNCVEAMTNGFGSQHFAFAVAGHANDWRSGGSPWLAARLNQPLRAFQTTLHPGTLGKTFSFVSCNNTNVMIKAIKKAEDSNEIVVRLQELTGQPQTAQLGFAAPIITARLVNGAEDPIATLTPAGGMLTVSLGGYQPMTLALTLAPPDTLVNQPESAPVTLPFNLDAISTDGNRADGNFDSGYTYPAELMPSNFVLDGITFQLGPTNDGAFNAVSCQGQTISLPANSDRVYLLAAAASNDVTGTFIFNPGTIATNITVGYFSGFIGQWIPPLLKKDEVAWVCTHRHTAGGTNDAYRFCYLFKYRLDLPPGTTSLTLPDSPGLRIFALSAVQNAADGISPAGGPLSEATSPWANAGPDRIVNAPSTNSPATVTLDGSASTDPNGILVSYEWSMNGTNLVVGITPSVMLPQGTNTVVLTVTDDHGAAASDAVIITVLPPLTVTITAAPTNASAPPLNVQFTGQATGGTAFSSDTTEDQSGIITAQGDYPPAESVRKLFDDDPTTKWQDFANAYPTTRSSWIQYQYASGQKDIVTDYTLTSANDNPSRDPSDWRLLGSNDGGSTWTTLDTRTGEVFANRFQKRSFSVASPAAFNIYRLQIDRVADPLDADSAQLADLAFIGQLTYSYQWSFGDGATSTTQNPQHNYSGAGNFLVILSVKYGIYTGTNTALVTVGPPLSVTMSGTPLTGVTPLMVQFNAQAGGGNLIRAAYDTTDDHQGTISAHGETLPNQTATSAFDNDSGSKWLDYATDHADTRASWIQYRYADGARFVVSRYTITSADDATTLPQRNPADWRLLASNDGGATWATLDSRTNQTFTGSFQKRSFNMTNTNAYNLYRLQIDSVSNPATADCVQLSEIELIGNPAAGYSWSFGDGGVSSDQNPPHTFLSAGVYPVTLMVSDGSATTSSNLLVNVLPPPSLSLMRSNSDALLLGWPSWASNFTLYSTTNLSAPVIWSPVMALTNGGSNVSIPILPDRNEFFRLGQP